MTVFEVRLERTNGTIQTLALYRRRAAAEQFVASTAHPAGEYTITERFVIG
jgi:hypothetical protein